MFPYFYSIPNEMNFIIIQKMDSYSYVRFRLSCRQANRLCERNERFLQIRAREGFALMLGDDRGCEERFLRSLIPMFFFKIGLSEASRVDRTIYGRPMTRASIEKFKKSIVGFRFDVIDLEKPYAGMEERFTHALSAFLEIVKDQSPKCLKIGNISKKHFEMVANTWKLRSLEFYRWNTDISFIELPALKEVPHVKFSYSGDQSSDKKKLVEFARTKERCTLYLANHIDMSVLKSLNRLMFDWKAGRIGVKYFNMNYEVSKRYFNLQFGSSTMHSALYLGTFNGSNVKRVYKGGNGFNSEKLSYWLVKKADGTWGRLKIARHRDGKDFYGTGLTLENATEERNLPLLVAEILQETFTNGPVVDLSHICKELEPIQPENYSSYIIKKRQEVFRRYQKTYRKRPIVRSTASFKRRCY